MKKRKRKKDIIVNINTVNIVKDEDEIPWYVWLIAIVIWLAVFFIPLTISFIKWVSLVS